MQKISTTTISDWEKEDELYWEQEADGDWQFECPDIPAGTESSPRLIEYMGALLSRELFGYRQGAYRAHKHEDGFMYEEASFDKVADTPFTYALKKFGINADTLLYRVYNKMPLNPSHSYGEPCLEHASKSDQPFLIIVTRYDTAPKDKENLRLRFATRKSFILPLDFETLATLRDMFGGGDTTDEELLVRLVCLMYDFVPQR